jgi:hypothetical protein
MKDLHFPFFENVARINAPTKPYLPRTPPGQRLGDYPSPE